MKNPIFQENSTRDLNLQEVTLDHKQEVNQ